MSNLNIVGGSQVGTALQQLLLTDDIQPGSQPSYQVCKIIYEYHPFGQKIIEKPINVAQSQGRRITVQDSPEDRLVEAFEKEWTRLNADKVIKQTRALSKVYGIASLALLVDGEAPNEAVDFKSLAGKKISFNVYDPLNTAGSLVLNQNPLAMDFQHAQEIVVDGKTFHKSRSRVVMNGFPIYISYTTSAFGFVGRSSYQRSLYPLKSFVQTMITNDMVSRKAGVIVAKIKQAGSVINAAMQTMFGLKRNVVKEAEVGNVISLGTENEAIESIDLKNLAEPFKLARDNIIRDIASGCDMPSKMLTEESFAEGFGEGTEDAKELARFVDGERREMLPLYEFMDMVVQHRAWSPEFFETMQGDYPEEYGGVDYEQFFYTAVNSFKAEWPSLLTEPESEMVKVADVKLRALVAVLEAYLPLLDPDSVGIVAMWVQDNLNEMKLLFGSPLNLDFEKMVQHRVDKETQDAEARKAGSEDNPFGRADSFRRADSAEKAIALFKEAARELSAGKVRRAA